MATEKQKEWQKEYYKKNREKILAAQKARQEAKKDQISEYQKEWWQKNKDREMEKRQLKKAQLTPEELAELQKSEKEYQKEYYEQNREKVLNRAKKWGEEHPEERYQASKKHFESNREEIYAQRRAAYPAKKAEEKQALEKSEMIGSTEAARLLGITLRSFRSWVKEGRIASIKAPSGRRMIKRSDVQQLIDAVAANHNPAALKNLAIVNNKLQLVPKAGQFIVPDGFDLITTYEQLSEYTEAFAAGGINFMLLLGTPGSGKSQQMRGELEGRCKWIDAHVTNLALYCAVYEAQNSPVVMDDINHFLKNKTAISLIKALTQTDEVRHVSWESPTDYLDKRHVPREFDTSSKICLIANTWDVKDADYAAVQDRALPVAFFPSPETIHNRVIELGWCDDSEILDFVGEHLSDIPQPSMREYYQARCYKRAKMDWRQKMRKVWGLE